MTRVTKLNNNSQTNWRWPTVSLGICAMRRLEQALQRKLDKKAAGRDACCENEELMSDLWFEGFPEPIERAQVVCAMYSKQDAVAVPEVRKGKKRAAQSCIKLLPKKDELRIRQRSTRSKSQIKIAA